MRAYQPRATALGKPSRNPNPPCKGGSSGLCPRDNAHRMLSLRHVGRVACALAGRKTTIRPAFPGCYPGLVCCALSARTPRPAGAQHGCPNSRPGASAPGLEFGHYPHRQASIHHHNELRFQRSEWSLANDPRALPWAGMNDAVGVSKRPAMSPGIKPQGDPARALTSNPVQPLSSPQLYE